MFVFSFRIFDDARREETRNLFEYSFHEHSLRVTDIKTGYGGCNAIVVSASEDRTCKVLNTILIAYFIVCKIIVCATSSLFTYKLIISS